MFQEYLAVIAQGIPTSLLLTVVSLFIAFFLALGLTFLLSIGNKLVKSAVNLFLVLFTGTPLLVQFFLNLCRPRPIPMVGGQSIMGIILQCMVLCCISFGLK